MTMINTLHCQIEKKKESVGLVEESSRFVHAMKI